MEGRPIVTPQQIMDRQIQLIDRFLDKASENLAHLPAQSPEGRQSNGKDS